MIQDIFFERGWAETVRLYSGLLEEVERERFIKAIAKRNILLAAECHASVFYDYSALDDYLENIALLQAKDFAKTEKSAKGILALAELNKYDSIIKIFETINGDDIGFIHVDVVSNYITGGNETQITTFLAVLSKTNLKLFEKAIDKVFDLDIFFSLYSLEQAETIYNTFFEQGSFYILAKAICGFKKKCDKIDPYQLFEILLEKKQIKYAARIIKLYLIQPREDVIKYLDYYIIENEREDIILSFLKLIGKYNKHENVSEILLKLSKHLNPKVKKLIFFYQPKFIIEKDLAYNIAITNLGIGTKASIDFAFEIIQKYGIEDRINIETIVDLMLQTPKYLILESAYKIIIQNELTDSYSLENLIDLLLNLRDIPSLNLAIRIINENFVEHDRIALLNRLLAIILGDKSCNKLLRNLVFNEIQSPLTKDAIKCNQNYFGLVLHKFKGFYHISLSSKDDLFVSIPEMDTVDLKFHKYILLQFKHIDQDNIKQSKVEIVDLNPFLPYMRKFLFEKYFIGQILLFKVLRYDNKSVILEFFHQSNVGFIVPIREIAHKFVRNIGEYVSVGQQIKAKIIDFDKRNRRIYCSIKSLQKMEIKRNVKLTDQEVLEKIKMLQEVFSTKQ